MNEKFSMQGKRQKRLLDLSPSGGGAILYLYYDAYDPFIDYIKGICILLVVITHCISPQVHDLTLFCVWGDMAVPLFLLIQVFHAYKHGAENCKFSIKKIWNRLIKWYLLAEIIILGLQTAIALHRGAGLGELYFEALMNLGIGPGSYYPYIYVEFAVILYLIRNLIKKLKSWQLLVSFILLSELSEIVCSMIDMPQNVYRLIFFRYIFLIWLGVMIVRKGIVINKINCVLSVVSIVFVIFFTYSHYDLQPFIFTTAWKVFHWMCYFYVANIYILAIYGSYTLLNKKFGTSLIENMGKYSWEIFLVQMAYFTLPIREVMNKVVPHSLTSLVFPIVGLVLCIGTVLVYKEKKKSFK